MSGCHPPLLKTELFSDALMQELEQLRKEKEIWRKVCAREKGIWEEYGAFFPNVSDEYKEHLKNIFELMK
jgi:hypothetical protein